jgi:hypothetical protein
VYRVDQMIYRGTDLHRVEQWVKYTVRTGPKSGTTTECSLSDFAKRVSRPSLVRPISAALTVGTDPPPCEGDE